MFFFCVSDVEEDVGISKELDVRWPSPRLSLTPEHVQTYPEQPVTAILEFPEVTCPPVSEKVPAAIPEFWLELHFCGPSLVTCNERSIPSYSDNPNQKSNFTTTSSTQVCYKFSKDANNNWIPCIIFNKIYYDYMAITWYVNMI